MSLRVPVAEGPIARVLATLARLQYGPPIVESTRVYANHPRLLRWWALYNRAVEKPDRVPKRLRELAVLKAATLVDCEFCIDIGSEYLRREGLSDEQLLALHRAADSGLFSADELLVIDYARAMSLTPPTVTDEQAASLRERFGTKGLIELTHLIAWENVRARTNNALGVGAGGFSEGRVCALPDRAIAVNGAPAPRAAAHGS
jgi:4-carboxymuconolactone decarboxylase